MSANLYQLFEDSAAAPDALFLRTPDGRRLTYGETFAAAGRYAAALAGLGVEPGDRVVVQVEKSVEAILVFLACQRLGVVFVPLNTAYTLAELEYFIQDAEPRLVVCVPDRRESVGAIAAGVGAGVETLGHDGRTGSLIAKAEAAHSGPAPTPRQADDLAAILYTSGTTGRSKGAMLTHDNLASNALTLKDLWRFGPDDVLIHALPVYHTHGLFVAINTTLLAGGSMIYMPKFDIDQVIAAIPEATAMMGVPTFYVRLVQDARLTRELTRRMRLFISGSAPLLAETHQAFFERTGQAILERYGMTETNMTTSNPYDGARIAGTVGQALPQVDVRIRDPETGAPLPLGGIGMIEVKGPNVFKGYWRMPEKTAAEFRSDGYFITGDLGVIDEAGYVTIVGRGKDLIISGGLNVYPKEVEGEIDALAGVEESAVFATPHTDLGEAVAAAVVLLPGAALTEADIIAALRPRLAGFKLPKTVVFLKALPRNAMGKVQKAALRADYA